jgi:hypothetical protein
LTCSIHPSRWQQRNLCPGPGTGPTGCDRRVRYPPPGLARREWHPPLDNLQMFLGQFFKRRAAGLVVKYVFVILRGDRQIRFCATLSQPIEDRVAAFLAHIHPVAQLVIIESLLSDMTSFTFTTYFKPFCLACKNDVKHITMSFTFTYFEMSFQAYVFLHSELKPVLSFTFKNLRENKYVTFELFCPF